MSHFNNFENLKHLSSQDEVKFVIGNRGDFCFAKEMVGRLKKNFSFKGPIHFSPVFGKIKSEKLAKWILEERLPVHLQLQLQKIIWPKRKKGV